MHKYLSDYLIVFLWSIRILSKIISGNNPKLNLLFLNCKYYRVDESSWIGILFKMKLNFKNHKKICVKCHLLFSSLCEKRNFISFFWSFNVLHTQRHIHNDAQICKQCCCIRVSLRIIFFLLLLFFWLCFLIVI